MRICDGSTEIGSVELWDVCVKRSETAPTTFHEQWATWTVAMLRDIEQDHLPKFFPSRDSAISWLLEQHDALSRVSV